MMKIAGIDIGGTKTAVVIGEYENDKCTISNREVFATADRPDPYSAIDHICSILSDAAFDAIGISCGGPLDSRKGIILSPPNLPGWDEIRITEILGRRFGVPVRLCNDANACAVAEWKLGSGRGYDNIVFMTFGTGLGAGLILNGRLYTGTSDMAGEIGHVRLSEFGPVGYGKAGSAEGFVSGNGIKQLALLRLYELSQKGISHPLHKLGNQITAYDVFSYARDKDPLAVDIINTTGEKLGEICAILTDLLNPEAVIIGSIYERNHDLLYPVLEKTFKKEALSRSFSSVRILPASLGDSIGDYAALMTAVL